MPRRPSRHRTAASLVVVLMSVAAPAEPATARAQEGRTVTQHGVRDRSWLKPGGHAGVQVVDVSAREYAFAMPDTIAAGVTTFRLRNEGREPHHLMLYRLERGRTVREVYEALAAGGAHPPWMHPVGGPNATIGPRPSVATVDLPSGTYAVFCFIPSPDGRLHFSKGMLRSLAVVPATSNAASLPVADVAVELTEYGFHLSRPLSRGHHRIAVTNRGTQAHELILSRLAPGKTTRDFVRWIETQDGRPPIQPWGGTTDLAPGRTVIIEVNLKPGTYSLLCRVRDAGDGRPHDRHGMMAAVQVR